MQQKVRQLVVSAIMRNETLKNCNLSIQVQGYNVTVMGAVSTPQEGHEALNTIQAVSPLLKIDNRLEIKAAKLAKV